MTTEAAVIAGHIPVLLVDSAARQRCRGHHGQKVWIHLLLVKALADRLCGYCHLLLETVVGRSDCSYSLHSQDV